MPRLARLRYVSIGHPNARLEDLTLDLRDGEGRATDSTLWLRNGGGKSSILNLFFALLRPDRREFLGGRAEAKRRKIEDYVLPEDRAVLVAEWELDPPAGTLDLAPDTSGPERYLSGVFYEWRQVGGGPSLRRLFFAAPADDAEPRLTIDGLPLTLHGDDGELRRRTMSSFKSEWTALAEERGAGEVITTEHQREWHEQLDRVGIDTELFAYQIRMNQREGGVDELFRFDSDEAFVDFLLELALDPALGERVGRNIATFKTELKERRDRLVPERVLLEGLAARLSPLVGLTHDRAALSGRLDEAAATVTGLRLWGDAEVARFESEAEAAADAAKVAERDVAVARASRAESLQRAAGLRLAAAQARHAETELELDTTRHRIVEAERLKTLWEAAVPLRNALRFERQAEQHRKDLEQKQSQNAPALAALEAGAVAYAGALATKARRLRLDESARRADEEAARAEVRELRRKIGAAHATLARVESEIRRLEGLVEEHGRERRHLEVEGALEVEEPGEVALARLDGEVARDEARLEGLRAELKVAKDKIAALYEQRREASAEEAAVRAKARAEAKRLAEATALRRELEEHPRLRSLLEVESLDLERLPEATLAQLGEAARRSLDQVVRLKIERAADVRAVVHLEERGLLPPGPDAERVLEALAGRVVGARSGWAWLEAQGHEGEGPRGRLRRAPHLAVAVVVPDDALDEAASLVARSGLELDGMVALVGEGTLADDGAAEGVRVVGPASDAWFDRAAAEVELGRRQARLDSYAGQIVEEEARRSEIEGLVGRIRELRRRFPRGWFAEQEARVTELEERAATHAARASEAAEAARAADAGTGEASAEIERIGKDQARRRTQRALVGQFVRQHEARLEAHRAALADARAARETARAEEERWAEVEATVEARATELSDTTRKLGEEARAVEQELSTVEYVTGGGHLHAAARGEEAADAPSVDELRERYKALKAGYEERVDEDGLVRLRREAEGLAREERRRFTTRLGAGRRGKGVRALDEASVLAALRGLDDAQDVETRLDEASRAHETAQFALGELTAREKQARDALTAERRRCREARAEVPEGFSGTPEDAEARAFEADEAAALAGERIETRRADAERARARHAERNRAAEGLRKDRAHLDAVVGAHAALFGERLETATPAPVGGLDADELVTRVRGLEVELKGVREELSRLDGARSSAVRALRAWATDPKFEALSSPIARQFSRAEAEDLEGRAPGLADELALRVQIIASQLEEMDKHREVLVSEALAAAEEGLALVRAAAQQSRLPEHLPGLGGARFLRVTMHVPEDGAARRERIAELVDQLLDSRAGGEGVSGLALVQQAVRKLARPIRVSVLNPDPVVGRERVDITDMARFSGGEQLTSAILLYCTLAQLRVRRRGMFRRHSSLLALDNPIGRASRVRFLELQREVARAMDVQLVYTTAVNDYEALRALPNVIRVKNQRIDKRSGYRVLESDKAVGRLEAARIVRGELPPQIELFAGTQASKRKRKR